MTRLISAMTTTAAPPEEVWKLLYDPSRFASWWSGVRAAERMRDGRVVFHRDGGAAMPSLLTTDRAAGQITVSCMKLDVRYEWLLSPLERGGTRISARCTLPEDEAARHQTYRAAVALSLRRLAVLAAESVRDGPRARG
jgi:hypothetical protein